MPYYRHLVDDDADIGLFASGTSLFNVGDDFGFSEAINEMVFGTCPSFLPVVFHRFSIVTTESHGGLLSAPALLKFMRNYLLAPSGVILKTTAHSMVGR